MTKTEAIKLFGNGAKMGAALGVTRAAISRWPDELKQWHIDIVTGAAYRLKLGKFKRADKATEKA